MSFDVEILAHSVAPGCHPLLTARMRYPCDLHQEHLRHRMKSFSVSSGRAIPADKQLARVEEDPALPVAWQRVRPGMSGGEEFPPEERAQFVHESLEVRDFALATARRWAARGLHKTTVGRLVKTWGHYEMVVTACWPCWANFYTLRISDKADPPIRHLAILLARLHRESVPEDVGPGGYHVPYLKPEERDELRDHADAQRVVPYGWPCLDPFVRARAHRDDLWRLIKLSVARTGRVSYDHHGIVERPEEKDLKFFDDRLRDSDFSVFEHVSRAPFPGEDISGLSGNLPTWIQLRQTLTPNVHSDFPWETLDRIPAEWCKDDLLSLAVPGEVA